MSDQVQEILDVPREFVKDGLQFMNRCQKPDKREFWKIAQAVGVGFLIMGAVGYVVKLIHIPLNGILVGGA
ncbi:Sec61p translocation complex subunit [Coniochaeta pulveracea]|uniref:Sec61p translocation complex subunit n=1 Tax=Coniochaeta pulveracea TaxID=177199 RepID=A0A420YC97_9PEZI|nr:Sec61p translocation complex subunit [Coniochaeta pulveracea]